VRSTINERLETQIQIALQANHPVLLWGPPGVGKSSYVEALAGAKGVPVEVVIASLADPTEFAGLPVVRSEGVSREAPAWAQRLAKAGKGILFLDEVNTAPPAVQAALQRLILDSVLGDLALPKEVRRIAAANPPDQASGGWLLSAAIANRFVHLDWTVDVSAWIGGSIQGWDKMTIDILPEVPWASATALVTSFLRSRPQLAVAVPDNEVSRGGPWPSFRTWTMLADIWGLCSTHQIPIMDDARLALARGCVGEGPALEFVNWVVDLDLPDPEELLAHPASLKLPTRGDKQWAILSSVAYAVIHNYTEDRWLAAWEIMGIAANSGAADVAGAAVRMLGDLAGTIYAKGEKVPIPGPDVQRAFAPLLSAINSC